MKTLAQAQLNFFYAESLRLYLLAAQAMHSKDLVSFNSLALQHQLVQRRFYEAKTSFLSETLNPRELS
jgi:hypothetical protein